MRTLSIARTFWALLCHEFKVSLKGPLFWLALICLLTLALPTRMAFGGDLMFQGHYVGGSNRMVVALVGGYTLLVFYSTLYALCICLERAGSHYLKFNDILILSRGISRMQFCSAKLLAIFLNALLYESLGLLWLCWQLPSENGPSIQTWIALMLPLGLTTACVISVYFALRNVFGNFLIFFVWLIALPMFFLTGLWHVYADSLNGMLRILRVCPQLGGLHAWSLGLIHSSLYRPESSWALLNVSLWILLALFVGASLFRRKKL